MCAMQNCSSREQWRDFTAHPEANLLCKLTQLQAALTSTTHWVKIKSHTSVYLNKKADNIATRAYSDPTAIMNSFEPQTAANALQFYTAGADADVHVEAEEIRKHLVQSQQARVLQDSLQEQPQGPPIYTCTVQKLLAPNVGRHLLHTVLWSLSGQHSLEGQVAKRIFQCITNTFPTQSRLAQMMIAGSASCPFCANER